MHLAIPTKGKLGPLPQLHCDDLEAEEVPFSPGSDMARTKEGGSAWQADDMALSNIRRVPSRAIWRLSWTRLSWTRLADTLPILLLSKRARIARAYELIHGTRFAEADRCIETCLRREPDDLDLRRAHAVSAHNSGRFLDALRRWNALRALDPDEPMAWTGVACNFRELGVMNEARRVIDEALHRFPDDLVAITEAIRIAERRQEDELVLSLWKRASALRPDEREWSDVVLAKLTTMSRFGEAATFASGLRRNAEEAVALCKVYEGMAALRREDWSSARDLLDLGWLASAAAPPQLQRHVAAACSIRLPEVSSLVYRRLKTTAGEDLAVLHGLVEALIRCGRLVEAGAELAEALARHPDESLLLYDKALLAMKKECWDDAIEGFKMFLSRQPDNADALDNLSRARMDKAYVDAHAGDVHIEFDVRRQEVVHVEDEELRNLLLDFESLGQDCELGLVQRRFGAEPLGLLRWNSVRPDVLCDALDARFEGLGLPANTKIGLWGDYEYYLTDTRWQFGFHTWISQHEMEHDAVFAKMCKRLVFLRDKLLSDLASGDKIFVCNSTEASADSMRKLSSSLRAHGPATLLWVRSIKHLPPNVEARAGEVMVLEEGLIVGYLSCNGNRGFVDWDIRYEEWIAICRAAVARRAAAMPNP